MNSKPGIRRSNLASLLETRILAAVRNLFQLHLLFIALAISAAGCASGTRYSDYRSQLPPIPEGNGRIWFYRPTSMFSIERHMSVSEPAVKFDGQEVGRAVPNGFFHIEAAPGIHEICVGSVWNTKLSITVASQAEYYVRMEAGRTFYNIGYLIPQEVHKTLAAQELSALHLVTP